MKNKLFYYRDLIIIILFIFLLVLKMNFIFLNVFNLHTSIQSMLEPYSRILIARALPGIELKEDGKTFFDSPINIVKNFLTVVYPVDSQEPTSYFTVQFTPLRHTHSEVMAMVKNDEEPDEEEPLQAALFPEERNHKNAAGKIYQLIENGETGIEQDDDLTSNAQLDTDEPKILIYHSHTTESFVPTSGNAFSENPEESIVRVGEKLTERLEYNGIKTIHDKTVHDLPTRHESYVRSLETLEKILEENPQIEMVIDLHRDGVRREMTTTTINGKKYGKILLLVGSRENHPDWQQNYRFANYIKEALEVLKSDLSRGVKTRRFSYNQEVHPRSVLIEVGGHKNSIEEAERSIPYLSKAILEAYKEITN